MALPIFNKPALDWQVYNDPKNLVAQYGLDFTTYGAYTFTANGTVQQSTVQSQVTATGVGIDNSGNMNPVTVAVGKLFTENIPPFTKSLVALGASSSTVTITSAGGQTTATFYTGIYPGSIAQSNILGATKQAIAVYLPPGLLMMYAGLVGNIPDGWLYCNGAAISRTNYAALFSAIGTVYGAGDGSSTFNLPDFRGRFPRGWDNGAGVDNGRAFGSYQADAVAVHSHPTSMGFYTSGGNAFTYIDAAASISNNLATTITTSYYNMTQNVPPNNPSAGAYTLTRPTIFNYAIDNSETRPKNLAVNFIIKA